MIASDAQVQSWSDQRTRPRSEQIREIYNSIVLDIAQIDDVYAACTQETPTWTDKRGDFPPHFLTHNDILAVNAMVNAIKAAIDNNGGLSVVLKLCVRNN